MSRIYFLYSTCYLATQTVASTLPGFQGIKCCVKYLASNTHKPIFYPYDYYDGSNVIRPTWSGNQVEDYTIKNFIEWHKYGNHDRTINRRRSVSGILYTLIGVSV